MNSARGCQPPRPGHVLKRMPAGPGQGPPNTSPCHPASRGARVRGTGDRGRAALAFLCKTQPSGPL